MSDYIWGFKSIKGKTKFDLAPVLPYLIQFSDLIPHVNRRAIMNHL
jgi:hypothetical protein